MQVLMCYKILECQSQVKSQSDLSKPQLFHGKTYDIPLEKSIDQDVKRNLDSQEK
jgi:hypothetical protein